MSAVGLVQVAAADAAPAERPKSKPASEQSERATRHPLVIVVSTGHQHIKVYDSSGRVVADGPVSTGQPGHETPHGVFSIIAKERMHYSNIYDDAPMPWMERITWSGVALHAGNLPGYAASHGCIRLPYNFSRSLYAMTRIGTRVIVSRGDPVPRSFANPNLFAPLPSAAVVAARAASPTASAGAAVPVALLGITSAQAGVVPQVRTREQAAAERLARIANGKKRLEAAELSKANLASAARTASDTARNALAAAADERAEGARIAEERRSLIADIAETRSNIAGLAKLVAWQGDTDEAVERGAGREQQLEDQLTRLQVQLAGADDAVATQADLIAASTRKADEANSRRVAAVADAKRSAEEVDAARTALDRQQREDANSDRPITVFVSRKAGKLFVRQGFDDLFEAPVTIADANLPFGTHVFTAVGETSDGANLTWSLLTVQGGEASASAKPRKSQRKGEDAGDIDAATAARSSAPDRVLERIGIASEVRARIAEFIKPGSTLIVSDHAASHETGRGTDFVILTR